MSIVTRKVREELLREREQTALHLLGSGAKDFAEYRFLCGFIGGLDTALALIDQVVKDDENQGLGRHLNEN